MGPCASAADGDGSGAQRPSPAHRSPTLPLQHVYLFVLNGLLFFVTLLWELGFAVQLEDILACLSMAYINCFLILNKFPALLKFGG